MHWAIKVDKLCHIRERKWDSTSLYVVVLRERNANDGGHPKIRESATRKKVRENSRNAICRLLFARAFFASMHLSRDERQHLYFLPANSRMVRNSCITADTVLPRKGNRNCPGNTYTACLRPLGAEITFWQLFFTPFSISLLSRAAIVRLHPASFHSMSLESFLPSLVGRGRYGVLEWERPNEDANFFLPRVRNFTFVPSSLFFFAVLCQQDYFFLPATQNGTPE